MKRRDNIGLGAAQADAARSTEEAKLERIKAELAAAGMLPRTLREIMATKPVPVEWIVADFIAAKGGASRGFKGDIIAPPKKKKTMLALGLASCVSAGRDWLGCKVTKARKVLYLDLELREDFNRERLEKIAKRMGANMDNLAVDCIAAPYNIRNRFDRNGERIEGVGHEDALIAYIQALGFELVVIDSQYKLLIEGEDENSGQGIAGILHFRDRIITETAAACLMVHHDNKNGGTDKEEWQRGAGSGFAGRDYDFRMVLDEHADGNPLHEVLTFSSRYRPAPKAITIVFDPETLTFSVDDSIPAKRLTKKAKKDSDNGDATSAAARGERERAKETALKIFEDLATAATARAHQRGGEPAPEDFLLDTKTFKSYLSERASLSERGCNSQTDILLGRVAGQEATLASVRELDRAGIKSGAKKSATIYIGLPARVEAYRQHFERGAQ